MLASDPTAWAKRGPCPVHTRARQPSPSPPGRPCAGQLGYQECHLPSRLGSRVVALQRLLGPVPVLTDFLPSRNNAFIGPLYLTTTGLGIKTQSFQTGLAGFCTFPCRAALSLGVLESEPGGGRLWGRPGLMRGEGCHLEGQDPPERPGASSWD